MMQQTNRLSRQAEIIPSLSDLSLLIIGAGGIGSNVCHMAVSMGVTDITIIDNDTVQEENLYPGFFDEESIDTPKVLAIANDLYSRYDIAIIPIVSRFEGAKLEREWDVVMICTDTLSSRQFAWETCRDLCKRVWIDGRMGGRVGTVFAVQSEDYSTAMNYSLQLSEAVETALTCGQRATAPLTKGFIVGMVGQILANIANEWPIPYIQRYDMSNGLFLVTPPLERQDEIE